MYSCFPVDKSCFTVRLSPALNTTSSPDFTSVDVDPPSTFPPAFAFQPRLFTTFAISFAVVSPSVVGTAAFPSVTVIPCVTVSYFTFPAVSTLALVNLPSMKFNPSAKVTSFLVISPFAV